MATNEGARVPPEDVAGQMVCDRFKAFLETFRIPNDNAELTEQRFLEDYMQQIAYMIRCNKSTVYVNFEHLKKTEEDGRESGADYELGGALQESYYRFEPYLRYAVQIIVSRENHQYAFDLDKGQREFFVAFYNMPMTQSIRQLRCNKVGGLIAITATVTRTSEVRPELYFGCFMCNKCASLYPSVEQQYQYTEPVICTNSMCNKKDFLLMQDKSYFVDFQRMKAQENADQIPAGSMPRCIDVICRNECVEIAKAGDKVIITGHLAALPDTSGASRAGESTMSSKSQGLSAQQDGVTGLKSLGVREMTYKLAFIASSVQVDGNQPGKFNNVIPYFAEYQQAEVTGMDHGHHDDNAAYLFTEADMDIIRRVSNTNNLYTKLTESICPSVFGHNEVKRGILLMLLGGVHKTTKEGISLRGDINVCIVGDPSCAKSQFLKYVHGFLPRTVYTSGKSSTAAGLTACVVRDPETGEHSVEAGALMLADNGICCIDEFDKMDAGDQVAIHEAMEQQTISITKAGIQATLNARTSILAAANPLYGRYDVTKPLKHNINISPAIMSRFDLFFIIIDECIPKIDQAIARHIIEMHKVGGLQSASAAAPFTKEELQKYIMFAKNLQPQMTKASYKVLVDCYRLLRQNDLMGKNKTAYRITVRQLESLVRLSEALARLHLDPEIKEIYVREAHRLLQRSIIFVESHDIDLDVDEEPRDAHMDEEAMDQEEPEDEHYRDDAEAAAMDVSHAVEEKKVEPPPPPAAPVKKASVSAKEYEEICQLLYLHLKQQEENFTAANAEEDFGGCKWIDLVDWYMLQYGREVSEPSLQDQRRKLVGQIIRRIIKHEGNFVVLNQEEVDRDKLPNEQKVLKLHPSMF